MDKPSGIIVFGANGSGKTTLGRELAHVLNFKHMDIEDYCFESSEIPYTKQRPKSKYLELMLADIEKYRCFVISTVTGDLGDTIPKFYRLAVSLSAPFQLRMDRVKQRSINMFGDRVLPGGDMYEQEQKFFSFVASRSLSKIDEWSQTIGCPIIHVDGSKNLHENVANIVKLFYSF